MEELIKRHRDLITDPQSLQFDYWVDPHPEYGLVLSHQLHFRNIQTGLRNRIRLWDENNCDDPDDPSPVVEEARAWAVEETPDPDPQDRVEVTDERSESNVRNLLLALGWSVVLVPVVLAAILDPEPASKLALAGLSVGMIAAILTNFGLEDEREIY